MTETNYAVPPGHYLQEWLTEHDMSLSDAMRVLPIEPDVLLDLVYGHTPVIGVYAMSLAELTGIPIATWLRYEVQYQADKARLATTSITPLSNNELNEMSLRVDAARADIPRLIAEVRRLKAKAGE